MTAANEKPVIQNWSCSRCLSVISVSNPIACLFLAFCSIQQWARTHLSLSLVLSVGCQATGVSIFCPVRLNGLLSGSWNRRRHLFLLKHSHVEKASTRIKPEFNTSWSLSDVAAASPASMKHENHPARWQSNTAKDTQILTTQWISDPRLMVAFYDVYKTDHGLWCFPAVKHHKKDARVFCRLSEENGPSRVWAEAPQLCLAICHGTRVWMKALTWLIWHMRHVWSLRLQSSRLSFCSRP